MKELSIEEKAKHYDEAIERAKRVLLDCTPEEQKVVEYITPELKENNDEKIIESLRKCFEWLQDEARWTDVYGSSFDSIFSWLEKHGEHANFLSKIQIGDKVTRNEAGILVNISQLNRVAKPTKRRDRQKSTDEEIQNSAWSKEDTEISSMLIELVESKEESMEAKVEFIAWIKSLKDKVLLKPEQEWSEEDETKLITAQTFIRNTSLIGNDGIKGATIDWLNDLKDRFGNFVGGYKVGFSAAKYNQWKPSDEQMGALANACDGKILNLDYLNSLYQDLKKLRRG